MSTIFASNVSLNYLYSGSGNADFGAYTSHTSTSYEWVSSIGHTIIFTGTDITVDGANLPTGGTVTSVTINSTLTGDDEITVTDIAIDITAFDFGTGGHSNNKFWSLINDGGTDITFGGGIATQSLAGDFSHINTTKVTYGSDDTFRHITTAGGKLAYGEGTYTSAGLLIAGHDTFIGTFDNVYGDLGDLRGISNAVGGNDTITFTLDHLFDAEVSVYGDVNTTHDTSVLSGGNDVIDLGAVTSPTGVFIYGDAYELLGSSFIYGGNDIIYGAATGSEIYGDVREISNGTFLDAGDDTLHGGNDDDVIYGDYKDIFAMSLMSGGHDWIDGNGGNDLVISNQGNDTIYGGSGHDTLIGGGDDDRIYGDSGNDSLDGGLGRDKLYDGTGNDIVDAGDGDDYVRAGGGADTYYGGDGTDDYLSYYDSTGGVNVDLGSNTISRSWGYNDEISDFESFGGSKFGNDTIRGSDGNNRLKGYGGDDKFYDGYGDDRVYGGDGDDYVRVGGGVDYLNGGAGTDDYISYYDSPDGIEIDLEADTISGSWGDDDTIKNFESAGGSDGGNDIMKGTSGNNRLKAYAGDDMLYGRSGNDKLYGGDDDDYFDGGHGNDKLYGGTGVDTFHFDFGEDYDTIMDFENNIDVIQLDNFTFAPGDDAFTFATEFGANVIFDFGGGDMLTVENTTIAQLLNDVALV